jgi:mannose-6-phosphate isomerase-like protein (cupin superfamily)
LYTGSAVGFEDTVILQRCVGIQERTIVTKQSYERVASIRDVYERPDEFFERESPGKTDPNLPTPSVVTRTPGTTKFRGRNLWVEGKNRVIQLAEVAPGDRKYLHRHDSAETVWVIIEGEGEFYPDLDTVIPIAAGMICHAFPGEWHGLGNTGTGPLRYINLEGPFVPGAVKLEYAE